MLTRVTSEFQITSCQCNKNKKIVHNAAMGQNTEVLGDFFPCDSFVALYELFELFLDEGKLSAINFIECQTTLTPTRIYQKGLFDDSPTPLLFWIPFYRRYLYPEAMRRFSKQSFWIFPSCHWRQIGICSDWKEGY